MSITPPPDDTRDPNGPSPDTRRPATTTRIVSAATDTVFNPTVSARASDREESQSSANRSTEKDSAKARRETALPTTLEPVFTPDTVFDTAKAADIYARIVETGGWEMVPGELSPGSEGPAVAVLRRRLAREGDLPATAIRSSGKDNNKWDAGLTAAVRHFQERMGLKANGVVAGATLRALNVPAQVRFRQLASSAQRIAGSDFSFGDRYIVVNIPSASVEAVQRGRVARRHIAVVGDSDHRSPEISARIEEINLNPFWTVPASIIKNEIIPHMRQDAHWLDRERIRIFNNRNLPIDPASIDWNSDQATGYILRQDSGAGNSLGSIRIKMPNRESVYMHDTPSKKFFSHDYRFLSHGCVRVEGVYDLAAWLLEGTVNPDSGYWQKDDLLHMASTQERVDIRLVQPVPVIWVYLTGWADSRGIVHFRDDVYNVDIIGANPSDQTVYTPVIAPTSGRRQGGGGSMPIASSTPVPPDRRPAGIDPMVR
jgi:murein L,D-transpeptidase YcbB/YkuD